MLLAWGRLNSSSSPHSLWTLGVQPADTNNKQRHGERKLVTDRQREAEETGGEEEAKEEDVFHFYFVSTECDSSCSCYRLSASPWLLLLFIALLMTIAVSPTDLQASNIQWGAIKLIPNKV